MKSLSTPGEPQICLRSSAKTKQAGGQHDLLTCQPWRLCCSTAREGSGGVLSPSRDDCTWAPATRIASRRIVGESQKVNVFQILFEPLNGCGEKRCQAPARNAAQPHAAVELITSEHPQKKMGLFIISVFGVRLLPPSKPEGMAQRKRMQIRGQKD